MTGPSRRRGRAVRAVLALAAALAVALPGAAFAGGPAPVATRIDVTSVVTPSIAVPATSGTPAVYVVKGIDFTVDLAFGDGTTSLPLSYTKDTTVSLKVVAGPDTGTSWTKTVPAGQTATTFTGLQFAHAGNGAVLQASTVAKKPADQISSDPTAPFVVLITSGSASKNAALTSVTAAGTGTTSCNATPQSPVCADLVVGNAATADGLLSLGACDAASPCTGASVQVLMPLQSPSTIRSAPATLVVKCDKSLCAGGGINSYHLGVVLVPGTPEQIAPSCPSKGVVGATQSFCVDYVQSTRDNAGDTHLFLLFVEDAKVRFP